MFNNYAVGIKEKVPNEKEEFIPPLMNNILDKKRPHKCEAGWWGTSFLNQIQGNCKPLPIAELH